MNTVYILAVSGLLVVGGAQLFDVSSPADRKVPTTSFISETDADTQALRRYAVNLKTSRREVPDADAGRIAAVKTVADNDAESSQAMTVTKAKLLKIRFLGYGELTGEYTINPDETVSIPVLGRISVAGMTAAQLEEVLSQKVSAVTGRKGYATVEISEFRNVFVTGVVKDSKSVAWMPGMTVLHAIALAGGTSIVGGTGVSVLSANAEQGRVQAATNDLKRSLALHARLDADRRGEKTVRIPERLLEIVSPEEAAKLISAQTEILKADSENFDSNVIMISQAIETTNSELESIKQRQVLIDKQITLVRKQREQYRVLQKKNLVSNTALLDLETKVAEAEEKNITSLVERSKLQGKLLDLQRELLDIKQKKQADLDKRIQDLEREMEDKEINLRTALRAVRTLNNGGLAAGEGNSEPLHGFEIVRDSSNGVSRVQASEVTRVQPGDIVVVSR